jgi:dTDP-4-dehydrorhamnose reductase
LRRILLLGKHGQLGWELQRSLAPLGEVIALDRRGAAASSLLGEGRWAAHVLCGDLGRPAELELTVRLLKPDFIVNAAAYTAVDRAESEREAARSINAVAPGALAKVSAELGACLIHYRTDYAFDGTG